MAAIIAALPFVLLLVAYHELPRIPVMRSSRFFAAGSGFFALGGRLCSAIFYDFSDFTVVLARPSMRVDRGGCPVDELSKTTEGHGAFRLALWGPNAARMRSGVGGIIDTTGIDGNSRDRVGLSTFGTRLLSLSRSGCHGRSLAGASLVRTKNLPTSFAPSRTGLAIVPSG